jgi:hypothetical protein
MKLSRRDALYALAGVGIAAGGTGAFVTTREDRFDDALSVLVAVAEVVYPSEIEGIPAFVETYSLGRIENRKEYREEISEATAAIDENARFWYDTEYEKLDRATRDEVLHEMGVHLAEPAPKGTTAERVRYYVVNELLYALYTTPTGGRLAGTENPIGYPGGTVSYQRGPR